MKSLDHRHRLPRLNEVLQSGEQLGWLWDKPAMVPRSLMDAQTAELILSSCSLVGSLSLYVTS